MTEELNGSFVLVNATSKRTFQVEQEIKLPGHIAKIPVYTLRPLDDKSDYQLEQEATACPACRKGFGIFRRKYPCSTCGIVHCDDCNPPSLRTNVNGKEEKLRCCGDCLRAIKVKNDAAMAEIEQETSRARAMSASASSSVASMVPVSSAALRSSAMLQSAGASSLTLNMLADAGFRAQNVYDFVETNYKRQPFAFSSLRGRPMVIMNVASKCGLTDAGYAKASTLLSTYKSRGLFVVLVPSNDFSNQEPGTEEEIADFACKRLKGTTVGLDAGTMILAKSHVNGPQELPLYTYLKKKCPSRLSNAIMWNFACFLVDRNGHAVDRFLPTASLEAIEKVLVPLLYATPQDFAQQQAMLAAEKRAEAERAEQEREDAKRRTAEEEAEHRRKEAESKKLEQERKFKENEEAFLRRAREEAAQKEQERMERHAAEEEQMKAWLEKQKKEEEDAAVAAAAAAAAVTEKEQEQQQQDVGEAEEKQSQQEEEAAAASAASESTPIAAAPAEPAAPAAQAAEDEVEQQQQHLEKKQEEKPAGGAPPAVIPPATELQDLDEFQATLSSNLDTLVVVRATATWCGACQKNTPDWEKLVLSKGSSKGAKFFFFDVDVAEDLADELQVEAMPLVIGYLRGNSVFKIQGTDAAAVEREVEKHRVK